MVLSQDGKIAVASSLVVFTLASILFFIVGFLCRHFCPKTSKTTNQTIPIYDNVQPKQYERELKLNANIAYGPVRTCH